jgi:hypothetical protein
MITADFSFVGMSNVIVGAAPDLLKPRAAN